MYHGCLVNHFYHAQREQVQCSSGNELLSDLKTGFFFEKNKIAWKLKKGFFLVCYSGTHISELTVPEEKKNPAGKHIQPEPYSGHILVIKSFIICYLYGSWWWWTVYVWVWERVFVWQWRTIVVHQPEERMRYQPHLLLESARPTPTGSNRTEHNPICEPPKDFDSRQYISDLSEEGVSSCVPVNYRRLHKFGKNEQQDGE